MEMNEARELYKWQYGRYPSSKMKLENIVAKLNLIEDKTEEIVEEVKEEKPWVTTIDKLMHAPDPVKRVDDGKVWLKANTFNRKQVLENYNNK